jgi:hypothetical protein
MGAIRSRAPIMFPKRQGLLLFVDAGAGAAGLSLTKQGREIHIHEREGNKVERFTFMREKVHEK